MSMYQNIAKEELAIMVALFVFIGSDRKDNWTEPMQRITTTHWIPRPNNAYYDRSERSEIWLNSPAQTFNQPTNFHLALRH